MSTVTTKLNLVKPASPEQFSLATYNNNLDLIDAGVKSTSDALVKVRHAEFTAVSISNTAGASWDIGPLVSADTNSVNNTFAAANATSGKLDLTEIGVFEVSLVTKPRTNPGLNYVSIKDGSDSFFYDLKESGAQIKWENSAKATVWVRSAPTTIFFRTQWANTAICDSTVRIDKIQGP